MMLRGGEWLVYENPFENYRGIILLKGVEQISVLWQELPEFFHCHKKFFAGAVDSLLSKFNVKFSHFSETVKALNQKKQCQSPASLWRQSCAQIALSPWLPWHSKLQVKLYFVNHLHPCRLELLSDRNLFC